MKATKNYRVKFHCRLSVIALLGVVGLIALCGEPVDDSRWLQTVIMQGVVWATSWGLATWLCRHWGLNRVMNMLTWIERSRRIEF